MKKPIIFALALILQSCASTPPPPKEVFECSVLRTGDNGRFLGVRYLELNGEPAIKSSRPEFHEDDELIWRASSFNGGTLAHVESIEINSNPWGHPTAWNREGKISFRLNWPNPLPAGTRVFLEVPKNEAVFEGYPLSRSWNESGLYINSRSFKDAIAGAASAQIILTTPEKQHIQTHAVPLERFHTAYEIMDDVKQELDAKAENFETDCEKEVFEYIILH